MGRGPGQEEGSGNGVRQTDNNQNTLVYNLNKGKYELKHLPNAGQHLLIVSAQNFLGALEPGHLGWVLALLFINQVILDNSVTSLDLHVPTWTMVLLTLRAEVRIK